MEPPWNPRGTPWILGGRAPLVWWGLFFADPGMDDRMHQWFMVFLVQGRASPFHQPTLFCNLEWQARTLLGCRSIPEEADCDNLKHQVGALLFTSFRMAGCTPTPPAMHAAPPPELGSAGPASRRASLRQSPRPRQDGLLFAYVSSLSIWRPPLLCPSSLFPFPPRVLFLPISVVGPSGSP